MLPWGFLSGSVVKNLPSNAKTPVWSLVWKDPICQRATKPRCHNWSPRTLEPLCSNKRSRSNKSMNRDQDQLLSPWLEKGRVQQRRPSTAINEEIKFQKKKLKRNASTTCSLLSSHINLQGLQHPSPPEHPHCSSLPAPLGLRLTSLSWPGRDLQAVVQVSASPLGKLPWSPHLTSCLCHHELLHSATVVQLTGFPPSRLSAVWCQGPHL